MAEGARRGGEVGCVDIAKVLCIRSVGALNEVAMTFGLPSLLLLCVALHGQSNNGLAGLLVIAYIT